MKAMLAAFGLFAPAIVSAADAAQPVTATTAQAVFENLAQLRAGAEEHYLMTGRTTATLENLVGPDKHMRRLVIVAGEDYRQIVFLKGVSLKLAMPTGETIGVEMPGNEQCDFVFHKVNRNDTIEAIAAAAKTTVEKLQNLNRGADLAHLRPSGVVRLK